MTTPTLPYVIKTVIKNHINQIHTCLPGIVLEYDHKMQKAKVQPAINKVYRDGLVTPLPVIVDVPIIWPRTITASLTFPVNEGDYVLLFFAERNIDRFLSSGGVQDPDDPRKYDLTDAIAIPGLYPFSEESLSENNDDVLLIYNETKFRITKDGSMEMEIAKDQIINVTKDSKIEIKGLYEIKIEGNATLEIGGDTKITTKGNTEITSEGDTTVNAANVVLNVDGNANINASSANITVDDATIDASTVTINSATTINGNTDISGNFSNSGTTSLSGGGQGIARVGDSVEVSGNVTIASGSSAGSYPFTATGTVTSGSSSATSG